MKNRKGFTLVELLAVIAILAILVIIALPSVINMYNKAQKQTFLTEARNVYREAEKKFLANSISGKNTKVFNSEDSTKLDMNGKKLQYCVVLNNSGKVSDMKVSNGKWVASLNGKAIDELTIDDLEDGNLDDYECTSATDESCFDYITYDESEDGTLAITIEDATKCKNYLMSNYTDITEENATTLCNGNIYYENGVKSIHQLAMTNSIPKSDSDAAGLSSKFTIVEKVEVADVNKCKNYYNTIKYTDEESTRICTTNEAVNGYTLLIDVVDGHIPYYYYEKAGLKVTERTPGIVASITGYDASCGMDVIIPSKISGYNVASIGNDAFMTCYVPQNSIISDDYKVKFLNSKMNDEYNIQKVKTRGCVDGILTSVILPNTLVYIGDYAFYYDELTEVTIPSSVRYIGSQAFYQNKLQNVTFNGNFDNIKISCKAFRGENHSDKVNSISTSWCNE